MYLSLVIYKMATSDIHKKEISETIDILNKTTFMNQRDRNKLYNRVKSIIDHNHWYTASEISSVKQLAMKSPLFTVNQKNKFQYSSLTEKSDDYDDGCPDGISQNDWDDYCDRQD